MLDLDEKTVRWRDSLHEAAHLIVATVLGVPVEAATLSASKGGPAIWIDMKGIDPVALLTVSLAGLAGEQALIGKGRVTVADYELAGLSHGSDTKQARTALDRLRRTRPELKSKAESLTTFEHIVYGMAEIIHSEPDLRSAIRLTAEQLRGTGIDKNSPFIERVLKNPQGHAFAMHRTLAHWVRIGDRLRDAALGGVIADAITDPVAEPTPPTKATRAAKPAKPLTTREKLLQLANTLATRCRKSVGSGRVSLYLHKRGFVNVVVPKRTPSALGAEMVRKFGEIMGRERVAVNSVRPADGYGWELIHASA
jgi:hypothetical protein